MTCVAREELDEFPASKKEFTSTQKLGVSIIDGFTPVAVEGNKVTFKHVRLPGELTMAADKIILAVGQHAELTAFAALEPKRNIIETKITRLATHNCLPLAILLRATKPWFMP